jgi:hypothetical protein
LTTRPPPASCAGTRDALTGLFVQVLAVCAREGLVTVDLVAGDGTKVKASASKASSHTLEELHVSIEELQKVLEAEVSAWWRQADLLDGQEDGEPGADDAARDVRLAAGTRKRTADRLARAEQARQMLTERHGDTSGAVTALEQARQRAAKAAKRLAEETAAHQEKLDRYQASQQAKAEGGGGRAGRPPKPMDQAAKVCAAQAEQERAAAALQRALADPSKGNVPKGNTTDPHCRIMPAKTGGYMCARNLQALANDQQIILALLLHDNPIDTGALHPLLKAGRASLDAIGVTTPIGKALFDAGYASEANFTAGCEARLLVAVHNEAPPAAVTRPAARQSPRLGRHGRHDEHVRGQRCLQEAASHHRAYFRAAVRAHGTEPELPRRDGPYRASPVGNDPQPAEMLPQPATRSIGAGRRPGTGAERSLTRPRRQTAPSRDTERIIRPCQPKPRPPPKPKAHPGPAGTAGRQLNTANTGIQPMRGPAPRRGSHSTPPPGLTVTRHPRSGRDALNLAAMMTRRSLAAMSAVAGSALLVYHGESARRSCRSAGSWPTVAYQVTATAWQASSKGTVRSTAAAVRLRACPVPKICLESSIAISMLHLEEYLSITCSAVAVRPVVTRAMLKPLPGRSRTMTTVTGREPNTEYHRQVTMAAPTVSVLP